MGSSLCNQTRLYALNRKKITNYARYQVLLSGVFLSAAGTDVANNSQVNKT